MTNGSYSLSPLATDRTASNNDEGTRSMLRTLLVHNLIINIIIIIVMCVW